MRKVFVQAAEQTLFYNLGKYINPLLLQLFFRLSLSLLLFQMYFLLPRYS